MTDDTEKNGQSYTLHNPDGGLAGTLTKRKGEPWRVILHGWWPLDGATATTRDEAMIRASMTVGHVLKRRRAKARDTENGG